jgi:hypothetical protein
VKDSPRLVRFVVAVQRRPGIATAAAAGTLIGLGVVAQWIHSDRLLIAYFVLATCAATAVAEVGARATSLWARVCFTGLGLGATYPIAYVLFPNDAKFGALVAAAVAVPHATVFVANATPFLGRRAALAGCAALAVGLLPLVPHAKGALGPVGVILLLIAWVLALQMAFHAAAVAGARGPALFLGAAAAGATSGAFIWMFSDKVGHGSAWVASLAAGWFFASLLVPIASVGRSLTAAPVDHPLAADFGGPPSS